MHTNTRGPRHGKFLGSATVGEKGQIVIPAEAREKLDIEPGEKLLIFSGYHGKALMVIRAEQVTKYVSSAMAKLAEMEEIARGKGK